MVVVSSREFRANQRKYFDLARTNDVVITSRSHGSYRLVPISEDDTLIDRESLDARIRQGIQDYEAGKVIKMKPSSLRRFPVQVQQIHLQLRSRIDSVDYRSTPVYELIHR